MGMGRWLEKGAFHQNPLTRNRNEKAEPQESAHPTIVGWSAQSPVRKVCLSASDPAQRTVRTTRSLKSHSTSYVGKTAASKRALPTSSASSFSASTSAAVKSNPPALAVCSAFFASGWPGSMQFSLP